MKQRAVAGILALIVLGGLALRLTGIGFGLPSKSHTLATYHPDESIHLYSFERLNPAALDFYPGDALYWGTFHFYLQGALTKLLNITGYVHLGDRVYFQTHLAEADKLYVIGRMISVVFGTGAIMLFYLIARKLYGTAGGIIGAVMVAVTPLAAVTSLYAKPDAVMFFWYLASIWCAFNAAGSEDSKKHVLYGAVLGLAAVSKYSAVLSLMLYVFLQLLSLHADRKTVVAALKGAALASAAAVIVFIAINPYAVLRFHDFWRYFGGVLLSKTVMPANVFDGYRHYLLDIVPAAIGWPLLAVSVAGMVLLLKRATKAEVAMLGFTVVFVLRLAPPRNQMVAYCLPLVPFLLLFGVKCSIELLRTVTGKTVLALVLLYTAAYAVSYKAYFTGEDTREAASRWIEQNIDPGAPIALTKNDYWTPPVLKEYKTRYNVLTGAASNSPLNNGIDALPSIAAQADYVVISSLEYAEAMKYPHEFPRENAAIRSIFGGEYEQIALFERKCRLAGMPLYGDFVAFDWMFPNPTIHVLKRTKPS